MQYKVTQFKNLYDNTTDKVTTIVDFVGFLRALSTVPYNSKGDARLISPSVYKEGTTRANTNVKYWAGWCALDVDDHQIPHNELVHTLEKLCHGYEFVMYSTASSTKEKPKFRLVFLLDSPVPAEHIKRFWASLNKMLGGLVDQQTKDSSRMVYVPGLYKGSYHIFHHSPGIKMSYETVMQKYPVVVKETEDELSEEFKDLLRKSRINRLGVKYTWSGVRDCPFVSKKLLTDYSNITGTGWYHALYCMMVSIAGNAMKKGYAITPQEIETLVREIDSDGWYTNRPIQKEATRAINYVVSQGGF